MPRICPAFKSNLFIQVEHIGHEFNAALWLLIMCFMFRYLVLNVRHGSVFCIQLAVGHDFMYFRASDFYHLGILCYSVACLEGFC